VLGSESDAAVQAEPAYESLSKDALQCTGHKVWFDTHVYKASEGAGSVVGMNGTENKMSCHGGLNCDGSSFRVAHFADQHHIRVMSEDTAKPGGEIESDLRLDLNLADLLKIVFHRIFDGDDFQVGSADFAQ
jgi:hypothetical protein